MLSWLAGTRNTAVSKTVIELPLYGFKLALQGITDTWGALIQNLRCDADLTDEQVQKIIRIGDSYWELVGQFIEEGMSPDEFAEYIVSKSAECERNLREMWK